MRSLHKIFQFFVLGSIYDPVVFLNYLWSFIFYTKPIELKVLTQDQLKNELLSGKSLIRFGDGEVMIMMGRDIHYQTSNRNLNQKLRKIISDYPSHNFILALPITALTSTKTELLLNKRLRIWRLFRSFAKIHISRDAVYADAHSFYRQEYTTTLFPALLKNKHVICISKPEIFDKTLIKYLKSYSGDVSIITSSTKNSFDYYKKIISDIEQKLQKTNKKPLLLLSTGPASKVIADHFTKKNIQSIDIGHGLEIIGREIDYSNKI